MWSCYILHLSTPKLFMEKLKMHQNGMVETWTNWQGHKSWGTIGEHLNSMRYLTVQVFINNIKLSQGFYASSCSKQIEFSFDMMWASKAHFYIKSQNNITNVSEPQTSLVQPNRFCCIICSDHVPGFAKTIKPLLIHIQLFLYCFRWCGFNQVHWCAIKFRK